MLVSLGPLVPLTCRPLPVPAEGWTQVPPLMSDRWAMVAMVGVWVLVGAVFALVLRAVLTEDLEGQGEQVDQSASGHREP